MAVRETIRQCAQARMEKLTDRERETGKKGERGRERENKDSWGLRQAGHSPLSSCKQVWKKTSFPKSQLQLPTGLEFKILPRHLSKLHTTPPSPAFE